ncbi:uncharacterized protein LOC143298224 [Babylonia areolata]|uniref:uncharacterized protein LOC143298224 n=1 Tax=Babylonia areolata TaxID=304850 RepID=UPI003FD4114A
MTITMTAVLLLAGLLGCVSGGRVGPNLLTNGDFENGTDPWQCWNHQCIFTDDHYSGSHGIESHNRGYAWQGPSQFVQLRQGQDYSVDGFMKLYYDAGRGQDAILELEFTYHDDSKGYIKAAARSNIRVTDGWIHLKGNFRAPDRAFKTTRLYFQGPQPHINYVVDDAALREGQDANTDHGFGSSGENIDKIRKSDIHVSVAGNGTSDDIEIKIVQTRKSFPFGTAVAAPRYLDSGLQRYRDFIHAHFNWAVLENALKWTEVEPNRGQYNYQPALDTIHGLREHNIKIRAHNMVWSVDQFVQSWIKALWGQELRTVVKDHIHMDIDKTRGLVEHWDVNNENLHGWWYQNRLNDPSYNLELFRMAHEYDPVVKLFLNDYNVVAWDGSTNDYLRQAREVKNANVGLYGMGAQCHFGDEEEPNVNDINNRLNTLSQAGVPIWITELDVQSWDENKRADSYEKALTAFYNHPNVEGILFWGFWDQSHWRGEKAALVKGDNLELTAAGRRVLDLFESRWMTEVTKPLADVNGQFTVRGFHGDYEVHVYRNGHEVPELMQNFTLEKNSDHTVTINLP